MFSRRCDSKQKTNDHLGVAQSVERVALSSRCNLKVAGSSPAFGSTFFYIERRCEGVVNVRIQYPLFVLEGDRKLGLGFLGRRSGDHDELTLIKVDQTFFS